MFGHVCLRPGAGSYLGIKIFFPISNGTPNESTSTMGPLLSELLMSHGLQMLGGISRFALHLRNINHTNKIPKSKIPEGAKPLCLLIYADKSQLSSFGTAKAHPVLARCANLPVEMLNGEDVDGGHLVGWLPIICDHTETL
jgi:hypothetical protein